MKLTRTIILLVALTAVLFMSCKEHHVTHHHVAVDSLINIAYQTRNYDSILSLADLHQQEGTLSSIEACYWRGYAYSRVFYAQSANRLAGLLYLKAEYGQVIKVALPAIQLLKEKDYTTNNDYFNLLTFMGCCELKLDHASGAAHNFSQPTTISTATPVPSSDWSLLLMPIYRQGITARPWNGSTIWTVCCRHVVRYQVCVNRMLTSSGRESVCTVLPL